MSERVLHEWTASGSIIRIVEDDRGFFGWSAESGIVTDLIPTVFCKELARLAVRLSEQEARHRREVIETRIDTLTEHGDCVCPLYSVYGERLSAVDPECVVCSELKRLEGELAALEGGK